jgi:hypothetical protein
MRSSVETPFFAHTLKVVPNLRGISDVRRRQKQRVIDTLFVGKKSSDATVEAMR